MTLRRIACAHLPLTILVLAWKVVSARTFFLLLCGYLLGWASRIVTRYLTTPEDDGHLCHFEYSVLNLPLDRDSTWMNMGYWAVSRSMNLSVLPPVPRTDVSPRKRTASKRRVGIC
jgi:hypothetical protein